MKSREEGFSVEARLAGAKPSATRLGMCVLSFALTASQHAMSTANRSGWRARATSLATYATIPGGDVSEVAEALKGDIAEIYSNVCAFCAVRKSDGA